MKPLRPYSTSVREHDITTHDGIPVILRLWKSEVLSPHSGQHCSSLSLERDQPCIFQHLFHRRLLFLNALLHFLHLPKDKLSEPVQRVRRAEYGTFHDERLIPLLCPAYCSHPPF